MPMCGSSFCRPDGIGRRGAGRSPGAASGRGAAKDEVGVQLRPQAQSGSPHRTTDHFDLGIREVSQKRRVPTSLHEQVPEHRRACLVNGTMKDQHQLVFPHLGPEQRTLPPMLGADQTVRLRLRRDQGGTVTPLLRRTS